MLKHNQNGAVSGLGLALALSVVLLISAMAFGGWAYTQMTDYRDNSDAKVQTAEAAAIQKESTLKDKAFAEQEKSPTKIYNGPAQYGGVHIEYPKSWSGYVDDTGKGASTVDAYFSPGVVPSKDDQGSVFALRVEVVNRTYASVLDELSGQQKAGKLKVSAYALPKLPKIVGIQAVGQLSDETNVVMVVVPLRSQAIKIYTEGSQNVADFNKYILPKFSFSP